MGLNWQNDGSPEPFAVYLCKMYCARKGFVPGTVPEAAALEQACHQVLTRADGLNFEIICVVDRESAPESRFGLPPEAVQEIARACKPHAGRVGHTRMPAVIRIIEVGGAAPDEDDKRRLRLYRRISLFSKIHFSAWHVDTTARAIWTNAPLGGWTWGRIFLHSLLNNPRTAPEIMEAPPPARLPPGRPVVTWALLAVLAIMFGLEHLLAILPGSGLLEPHIRTLMALGSLNSEQIFTHGEWFRLLMPMLLHGSALHLIMNGIVLYYAGMVLERLVGRIWFATLFLLGGLGGAVASLLFNPATMVSVGASGAIMALLAAAYVCIHRLPMGAERSQAQMGLLRVLVPALLPIGASSGGHAIDVAAHAGGAITGAALALALWRIWPRDEPLPRLRPLARILVLAGLIGFAVSGVEVGLKYRFHAFSAQMIPPDKVPKDDYEARLRAKELLAQYPRDPRVHLFQARNYIANRDYLHAESALRAGLSNPEMLNAMFSPELTWQMKATLAMLLARRDEMPEARLLAGPVCRDAGDFAARKLLVLQHLCD